MSLLPFNGHIPRQWPSIFSESRKPKDNRPWVDSLHEHDPFNDGVRLCTQEYEHDKTFFPVETISRFCRGVTLQLLLQSQQGTTWLDDRPKLPISELPAEVAPRSLDSTIADGSVSGQDDIVLPTRDADAQGSTTSTVEISTLPEQRKYKECLTTRELYMHLLEKRFDHDRYEDADRRLIYIADPGPRDVMALTETVPQYLKQGLLDLLWQFIARRASLKVKIPPRGYTVFQLELHLPYRALRTTPSDDLPKHRKKNEHPAWMDLSFLAEGVENGTMGIHQAQFSFAVCGTDNSRWVAYALETKHFDPDRGDNVRLPDWRSDEISMGQLNANEPFRDPREYFLNVFLIRAKQVLQETEELLCVIEESHQRRALQHPSGSNRSSTLDWNENMLHLLRILIPEVSKTVECWARFVSPDKDIGYFCDRNATSSGNKGTHIETLRALDQTFDEMKHVEKSLRQVEDQCQKVAQRLEFGLARQGSQNGEFTIVIISPIVIVASIFAIPHPVFSFTRNSLSFLLTTALAMLSLQVLLLLNGGWHRRQRWWDKLSRRMQAAWRGDEALTTINEAGRKVLRRRSMPTDFSRES